MRLANKKVAAICLTALVILGGIPVCVAFASEGTVMCTAVLSVICEEGFDQQIEVDLRNTESGEVYIFYVSDIDDYQITVEIPDGTYEASGRIPQDEEGKYELFVDGVEKEKGEDGKYHFAGLAGSWLYTVENAELLSRPMLDENGDPKLIGHVSNELALESLREAEASDPSETYIAQAQEDEGVPSEEIQETEPHHPVSQEEMSSTEEQDGSQDKEFTAPWAVMAILGTAMIIAVLVIYLLRTRRH